MRATSWRRQIAKTRGDLETSERQLVAYAQQQGIINIRRHERRRHGGDSDTNSLQGESLIALNQALADSDGAAGRGRRRLPPGAGAPGRPTEVTDSAQPLRQQRATLESRISAKARRS